MVGCEVHLGDRVFRSSWVTSGEGDGDARWDLEVSGERIVMRDTALGARCSVLVKKRESVLIGVEA